VNGGATSAIRQYPRLRFSRILTVEHAAWLRADIWQC
jgi:hypothetical protein